MTLDLAERALSLVRAGDAAQATVCAERSLMLRYARSRPTQATAVEDLGVQIAVVCDGQVGTASTNDTGDAALAACARAAEAAATAAAASAGPGGYPGLPAPAEPRGHEGHDPETARLDPAAGGAALAAVFAVADELGFEAHGTWTAGEVDTAIASSTGVAVRDRVTDAFVKVAAIGPDGRSGYDAQTAVATHSLDPAQLARRAGEKALLASEPARLASGEYPVVLERHAVAELLSWLGKAAFNGLAYAEERSALCGRLGSPVAAPLVELSDLPHSPGTLPRAFDSEGVPKAPLTLVEGGVARGVAHDIRSAAMVGGGASTGHALAPGGSPGGPVPTNLVLAGGAVVDEAELCAPIERGVYVTRFWYVNPVRSAETLMTGVTRDGTFLIEDGRVTRPLADMRFTDSFLGVLERTEALTGLPALSSDGELYGRRFATGVVCPALRASALRFTA